MLRYPSWAWLWLHLSWRPAKPKALAVAEAADKRSEVAGREAAWQRAMHDKALAQHEELGERIAALEAQLREAQTAERSARAAAAAAAVGQQQEAEAAASAMSSMQEGVRHAINVARQARHSIALGRTLGSFPPMVF